MTYSLMRSVLARLGGAGVSALFVLTLLGSVPSVSAWPLNAPKSEAEYASRTLFSAFSSRSPKTLDPQRSYVQDESTYVLAIYEPLYQYHYLKRPYTVIPRTATKVVKPTYLDRAILEQDGSVG